MRTVLLVLLGGCTMVTKTVTTSDPVLLAASTRPVPVGADIVSRQPVELRDCDDAYQGVDSMIRRAQGDADALLQVSVEIVRVATYRGWGTGGTITGQPFLVSEQRCYMLRGERVEFRKD